MRPGRLARGGLPENPGAAIVDSSPPAPPPLDEGYYVENFQVLLDTVAERYADLLREEEKRFLHSWAGLTQDAQRLYVRLISRKGPCFRRDRLNYKEISNLDVAAVELEATALLDHGEPLPAAELLPLLLRPELAELARELGHPTGTARRDELLQLLSEVLDDETLRSALASRIQVLRPLGSEQVLLFRLLFFGNLYQDLSQFVITDLGVMRFESYALDRELRRFPDRKSVDDELYLRLVRQTVAIHLRSGAIDEALVLARGVLETLEDWHPQSRRHADRVLSGVARQLEREARLEEALELYNAATAPPARERRARVLDHLGQHQEARDLCREMLEDPRDETEVAFAPRFHDRMRRHLGEDIRPWKRRQRSVMERELERTGGVEHVAIQALAEEGRPAFFSENWLWKSLFGLAFWDIVFAPVAGAFQHPFQLGPSDLSGPDFRTARRQAIDERLRELRETQDLAPRLLARFDEKQGLANTLVSWHPGAREHLAFALEVVRGPHLVTVAERLVRDVRRYRRGFPDLFVRTPGEPGFELWEVKAPGDQLRAEQKGWIDYLDERGIPCRILRVRWRK